MDFEEFCAAAISPYQLEALENWEQIASIAFEHFEQEGNRAISIEELAQVLLIVSLMYVRLPHGFFEFGLGPVQLQHASDLGVSCYMWVKSCVAWVRVRVSYPIQCGIRKF
jgi:hypothetical protein